MQGVTATGYRNRFPYIGTAARICRENEEQTSSNLRWHNLRLGVDDCRSPVQPGNGS